MVRLQDIKRCVLKATPTGYIYVVFNSCDEIIWKSNEYVNADKCFDEFYAWKKELVENTK